MAPTPPPGFEQWADMIGDLVQEELNGRESQDVNVDNESSEEDGYEVESEITDAMIAYLDEKFEEHQRKTINDLKDENGRLRAFVKEVLLKMVQGKDLDLFEQMIGEYGLQGNESVVNNTPDILEKEDDYIQNRLNNIE